MVADTIELEGINPQGFRVRNHWLFLIFIACTKVWVGFWQGLVVYTSLLLGYWGYGVVCAVKHDVETTDTDGLAKFSIKWTRPVALASLLIGIEANVFSLERFVANAAKGSFGTWDQYLSGVLLAPPIILGVVTLFVVAKVLYLDSSRIDSVATRLELACWTIWLGSFGLLMHLLIGFNDPFTDGLISLATSVSSTKR